ncbi:MotA/TolQ/ExbB proton channel family protein [Thiohalospira sp.]|uniref:MotA/TolQ/ExbB proton channel family protein n=1 Tax=Thiohalospira sp. TaxID=3080549 RepID=UPI00397EECA7
MLELIRSGGWIMWPLLLCSVVAVAIIAERFWSLRPSRVVPPHLVARIWHWQGQGKLDNRRLAELREGSPLGRVLAAGLVNLHHDREVMKESIEEAGRQVVLELERFLNTLGTIASITPLLGLLGTVIGMIKVFATITSAGLGDPSELAGGISEALITTATGLAIAIPSLMFYRYFRGRVDELVLRMEEEALKLVEVIHGEREPEEGATA